VEDQIVQEIEHWRERRLHALKDVPAVDMDSWLQYTNWHEVLSGSGHGILKTSRLAREQSDPDEPGFRAGIAGMGAAFWSGAWTRWLLQTRSVGIQHSWPYHGHFLGSPEMSCLEKILWIPRRFCNHHVCL
jgi:hypothetical protein